MSGRKKEKESGVPKGRKSMRTRSERADRRSQEQENGLLQHPCQLISPPTD